MKAVAYEPESGNVQVDTQVSIEDFTKYIATLYGEAINNPNVTYDDMSHRFRRNLPRDQADFGIGETIHLGPALIAMGSKTPRDKHRVIKYFASDEAFGKFTHKLEEICHS